jgi:uncharacterized phage protein (TIGR01671 family)
MSNEIKFRGMSSDFKKWIYGYVAFDSKKENSVIIHKQANNEMQHTEVDTKSVGQYTEYKDAKHKEVFLGDLLNIGSSIFGFFIDKDGKNAIYEVQKRGCDYVLYRHDTKLMWGRLSRLEELVWECEVVGNIYENPELLETK